MTAIDILLFFAIIMMAWGLQHASQNTAGQPMRDPNTSNTEEALGVIRAINRNGTSDQLTERRLKGQREAVNLSQERIDKDQAEIDQTIDTLASSTRGRDRVIEDLDKQEDQIVSLMEDIEDITQIMHQVNGELRGETSRSHAERVAVENRIRDLETRLRNTAHQVEEVRGWLRL
jgi:chromosome segregation ATPase